MEDNRWDSQWRKEEREDAADKELEVFFVSLVGPLIRYFIEVHAQDDLCVRRWCAKVLGPTWCSVYREEDMARMTGEVRMIDTIETIWNYGEEV